MMISQNYANSLSYKVYIDYLALKKHFSTNYDYHKYHGKVKASMDAFRARKDLFFFYKLSQKPEWHEILIANLVKNPNAWIRDIVEDEDIYFEWVKKTEALTYNFKQELKQLDENYIENFKVVDGQHPRLITLYLQRKISLETLCILTQLSNAIPYWETEVNDKVVAGDIIKLIKNYRPFLSFDVKKFSEIVKDELF